MSNFYSKGKKQKPFVDFLFYQASADLMLQLYFFSHRRLAVSGFIRFYQFL